MNITERWLSEETRRSREIAGEDWEMDGELSPEEKQKGERLLVKDNDVEEGRLFQ